MDWVVSTVSPVLSFWVLLLLLFLLFLLSQLLNCLKTLTLHWWWRRHQWEHCEHPPSSERLKKATVFYNCKNNCGQVIKWSSFFILWRWDLISITFLNLTVVNIAIGSSKEHPELSWIEKWNLLEFLVGVLDDSNVFRSPKTPKPFLELKKW